MSLFDFVSASVCRADIESAPTEVSDFVYNFIADLRSDLNDEIVNALEEVVERFFDPAKEGLLQEVQDRYGDLGVLRVKKVILPRLIKQVYMSAIDQFVNDMHDRDEEEILEDDHVTRA